VRILVYKGGSQYNALNRFSEQLAGGLQILNHDVTIVDLLKLKETQGAELNEALKKKPDLVIGFNGIGVDLKTADNKSLYEAGGICYLELLLDHPAFHAGRVMKSPLNAIAGVVDHTHLDYLKETWPGHPVFFAPHGGIQSAEYENDDRPIDILFLGTGMDPEKARKEWLIFPPSYQSILVEAYEEFLAKPQAWDKLIARGAENRHIPLPTHLIAAMIVQLEIVMRAGYRQKILNEFDKAGLKVTIIGNGWEYTRFKHHELRPSAELYDALRLMTRAKVTLNASPQFFTGTHERVFASMLNGAVSITSGSRYYEEHFKDGEHYLSYDLHTLPQTLEKLKGLMAQPSKLMDIRKNALRISMRDHTWKNRARELIEKFPR
jgi:hypothetical protein